MDRQTLKFLAHNPLAPSTAMTTTRTIMRVVTVALLLASATALDVRLRDVQCDGSLPVTIADDGEFKIQCPNSGTDVQRCSFNGDSALLSGNCK